MTEEIRRLTLDDWPAIEAVIDSRAGKFQGVTMTPEWQIAFKENYFKRRMTPEWSSWVFFFGYFRDGTLMAIRNFQRSDRKGEFVVGVSLTMKPANPAWALEKHQGSEWPKAIVDLRRHAVDWLSKGPLGMTALWQMTPKGPNSWSRTTMPIDDPLYDVKLWTMEDVELVKAGEKSTDEFIAHCVMSDHVFTVDQQVTKFTLVVPVLPLGDRVAAMKGGHPTPGPMANTADHPPVPK